MRRQNKDWNAKKAYEERTKKSAASDEYIHNYRKERQRTAKYDTEQGAGLPDSLIKQARKNQEVKEAASRGEYTTKHRSGQVRTHKLPQEEAVNYFSKLIEDPSIPDQVRYPLEQASLTMQNLLQFSDEEDATLSYVNSFKADPPVQPAYEQPVSNEEKETPKKQVRGQGNKDRPQKKYDDSFIEDDLDLADRKIEGRTVIPDNPNRKGYVGGKKMSEIQKDLLKAGHTKEDLSALMEANKNRPKVTDLLKIFRKG